MSIPSCGIDGVSIGHHPNNPDHAAKPWIGRAKDSMGRWKGKWFATEGEALRWATNTSRAFAKGGMSTKVLMSQIGPGYREWLDDREKVTKEYKQFVDNVWMAMVRFGMDNVSSPEFAGKFERWVSKVPADWWVTDERRANPTAPVFKAIKWAREGRALSNAAKDRIVGAATAIISGMAVAISIPLLTHNPLRSIRQFQSGKDMVVRPCFTVEEVRQMVSDEMRDHPMWLPVCLAAYNPRRTAEAMHLRWEWINWEAMSVRMVNTPEIKAAGVRLKSGETSWPLEPELYDILKPMAKPHGWIIASDRIRRGGGLDLVRESKSNDKPRYTRAFDKYFADAGIVAGDRTAYNLRHTGITMRLAKGDNENLVAAWAAHSDPSVTLEHYARERAQFSHRVKHWGNRLYFRDPEPKAQSKIG